LIRFVEILLPPM